MQVLNLDDKALIIRDFLPEDLLRKLRNFNYTNFVDSSKLKNAWSKTLYSTRNERNIKDVKIQPLIYNINNTTLYVNNIFKEVEKLIIDNSFIPTRTEKYDFAMDFYSYEKNSGINWHDDYHYTLNFSLYIHDDWDPNWGGETLINTERGLPLVSIPFPNTLLCIKEKVNHKVCAVTSDVKRKVLQGRYNFED
jgi:Rps23 Pro-64 3,4-dihydroxylase Tpa1-like proline 4-hydroxylase